MKRILYSSAMILFVSAISVGATGAFFSDTETSTGNTFTAGAIDLKIDNHSYYNGNECANVGTEQTPVYQWQGSALFPVVGTPCTTSWASDNLQDGNGVTIHKFFDFIDLKPGDYSEDTISITAGTNDAYICANVRLTSDDDNTPTEPELLVDTDTGVGQGELAGLVNFIWWADDGDNVLETGENVLPGGALGALGVGGSFNLTLADTVSNIWNPLNTPGPVPGTVTKYIGKAWCFGTIVAAAVAQGQGNPSTNPGYTCNGSLLGNESQTDSMTADVTFSAVQARNNPSFVCAGNCTITPQNPGPNLVTNGGFEAPEVTTLPDNWDIFPSVAGGWSILWRDDPAPLGRPAVANLELHEGVLGVAFEGDQYAELDSDWNGHAPGPNGEESATTIYQNIPTVPGASYSLSYRFAPRPNTPGSDNDLESRLGGVVMNDTGPIAGGGSNLVSGDWVLKGPYNFVATTTVTQLRFTDMGSPNNSTGTFLDDVKLVQTSCVNP